MKNYANPSDITDRIISLVDAKREELNQSYEQMCQSAGIAISSWNKIKGGITQLPNTETLRRLANYLDVSVAYLIGETKYKQIDNDIILKELADIGFTEKMVENLKITKEKAGNEWYIYETALKSLFDNLFEAETLHIMYCIGKYMSANSYVERTAILTEDLNKLEYALENNDISNEALKNQIQEVLNGKNNLTSEEQQGYWLLQITHELQNCRTKFNNFLNSYAKAFVESGMTEKEMKKELEERFDTLGEKTMDVIFSPEKEKE